MPTDPNTYTLNDYAANSNDPLIKSTAMVFVEANSMFTWMPMLEKKSLKQNGSRITGALAPPTWVPINTPGTTSRDPDPEIWEEALYIHRDAVTCDNVLLMDENQINDPFDLRIKTKLEAYAFDMNYKMIQNRHIGVGQRVNPNAFVGFRERLDDPATYGTNPECKIDGAGVDISTAGTAATGGQIEYLIEQLFYSLGSPRGKGITLVMNNQTYRAVNRTIKLQASGGGFRNDKDAYDRGIEMYKEANVIDCGRQAPTGPLTARVQPPVISYTETADGTADTGGTFSSIYAFKGGMEDLYCWWMEPFKPSEPYMLNDGSTWQVNLNGTVGIAMPNTRAIGRIYDINLGTVTG